MSEFVSHTNNFATQIAEFAQANEALADPATRRDYFEHLDANDFISLTQKVASLVRTGESEQLQPFDGTQVSLLFHEIPDYRDKETLLLETWDTAKSFLTDKNIADEDALEYAALTVAGGLLLAHPFLDGNGRTSRYLSYIIAKGGQDETALSDMSESLSHEWYVTPSSDIAISEVKSYTAEQPMEIEWDFQFAGEAVDALGGAIANSSYKNLTIRRFIEGADEHTKQLIESCVTRDEVGEMATLDGDKLLSVLVNDPECGIANAQDLHDIKRRFQADYVREYLAAMRSNVRGDRRVLSDNNLASEATANSAERARRQVMANIVGQRAVDGKMLVRDEAVAQHRAHSAVHTQK